MPSSSQLLDSSSFQRSDSTWGKPGQSKVDELPGQKLNIRLWSPCGCQGMVMFPPSGLGEPALLRLCLHLPHRGTPWSCSLLSHQHFCAWTIPAESMQSSFYECPSCSVVFLPGSSLFLPCSAPCAAPQPRAGRPIPVISFFCCILQNGSSCQAHFASQSLTDWPTCNFCLCVYRRWRTEGKGGC